MSTFRIMALTLPGAWDPAIAIAASRAGELGILNLEHTANLVEAQRAIETMARFTRQPCGLLLDGQKVEFITELTSNLPAVIGTVILTPAKLEGLEELVALLHGRQLKVLLQCTSLRQARHGKEAGVDGLIAKGHEAGGWVGEETTFILLQQFLTDPVLQPGQGEAFPVWAHGGIGLHTAAAAFAAGAAGVVLDAQLALTRESPLPAQVQEVIERLDGSETICLGSELGLAFRMYTRPGLPAATGLENLLQEWQLQEETPREELQARWREAVQERIGWNTAGDQVWVLGQDAAFAAPLARQFQTVSGVLSGIRRAVADHTRIAQTVQPLKEHSPLAQSHGTRFPIVQGPMTRVSDRAEFALRVAEEGALPFLALALMRGPEVETLLEETQKLLGDRPWGVGILGFVPLALRQEQLAIIREYRPPFALIAGGRPDQAQALEEEGIPTYLHVPSPALLRLFIQGGARRFVFEGRECGGHVGPRSSFVLWNLMVDVLLEALPAQEAETCHVLFAGGIHDALSASMVAALAAPLAERGVKVGVLLGTSYLFTREAVESGAILPGFQEEAVRCDHTVLVTSGPGHAIRCVENEYTREFERQRRRLQQAGKSPEEIRQALEEMNIGRLRIASKGIDRHPRYGQDPDAPKYIEVDEAEQHRQGMYMIGQVAMLRHEVTTIARLHQEISVEGTRRLDQLPRTLPALVQSHPKPQPSQVAIVGIACLLPKAGDLQTFWENVLNGVNAITEIPRERWDWELYYDPDPAAPDKINSKWGGFLDDVPFDPLEFGMPPRSLSSIDPMQLLALLVARAALEDAGYLHRDYDHTRTSVILGASGGVGDLGALYCLRSGLPLLFGDATPEIVERVDGILPEWTEDSFAGLLLNVAAGRITNRMDMHGLNYVVDAACASSLTAVHLAVKELETYNTDMVITGGVDTVQTPFGYLCFSKTHALSPTGQPRTFDAQADGIAISEGVVMLVLKRLADAERDGDRIYAVIQGVGASSDGKAMGLTAPRPEGQVLALQRAYEKAGYSPTTVGLFEAHGTGTVVGDRTEALSLTTFLEQHRAEKQRHALGSVKSMIGHTKATAGVAGLAKVALALYHKVLPPTLGVTRPNPRARLTDGPLYINTEARPWIQGVYDHPRRAGVSAFGFGGTNFHVAVEEYTGDFLPRKSASFQHWPSELFLWAADSRPALQADLASLESALAQGAKPELRDLAYTLWQHFDAATGRQTTETGVRLAVIAGSLEDLLQKLATARQALESGDSTGLQDPRGIYLVEGAPLAGGKLAFLFPGQGSQYPNMLRDLAIQFPEVRETFERVDRVLAHQYPRPLSDYIFPPPAFTPEEKETQQATLTQTHIAQPALGAAGMALAQLLQHLGIRPDMVAGHSYGEYLALWAAGVFDGDTLARVSELRGRSIVEAAKQGLGTMAAVAADEKQVRSIIGSIEGVWCANLNAPQQTIISGTEEGVAQAIAQFAAQGIRARSIPVACAFHSPLVAPAQDRLASALADLSLAEPACPVFSNTTAAPYPTNPDQVAALLAGHLVKPVRFADEIEAMYEAGARIFVEVGPRNVLVGLTRQILGERPHLVLSTDVPGRNGLTQLQHTLAQLACHGVALTLERLFEDRAARRLDLDRLVEETVEKPLSPTTWLVNGGQARPWKEPATIKPPPLAWLKQHLSGSSLAAGSGLSDGQMLMKASPPNPPRHEGGAGGVEQAPAPEPARQEAPASAQAESLPVRREASPPAQRGNDPLRMGEVDDIMLQYQQMMGRFLETQRQVMVTYLQGMPADPAGEQGAVTSAARLLVDSPLTAPGTGGGAKNLSPRPSADEMGRGGAVPESMADGFLDDQGAPAAGVEQEPEQTVPASVSPVAADVAMPDRQQLTQTLLRIVSDRTGYPAEMLQLDVDIEADLGIDSIKRVEILGAVQQACVPPDHQLGADAMEELTGIKTLGGVVDWFERVLQSNGAGRVGETDGTAEGKGSEQPAPLVAPEAPGDTDVELPRLRLVAEEAPVARHALPRFSPADLILVTDDGQGVATTLVAQIQQQGGRACLLRHVPEGAGQIDSFTYRANLTDPQAVLELVQKIRQQHGPMTGLVHLLPLGNQPEWERLDLPGWRAVLQQDVKSLFYLTQAMTEDLSHADDAQGRWLVAATAMGGKFGVDASVLPSFFPGQAGVAGFVKTAAQEWPQLHCKVVDFSRAMAPVPVATALLQEMALRDGRIEVGYVDQQRFGIRLQPAPLDPTQEPQITLQSDWVILMTGGARGITAEIAGELARRYQPTLVLVGRSPLPATEESAETIGLTAPQEIKAALIQQMRAAGKPVAVPQVEALYQQLLKEREIRQNLQRMAAAGAQVHYFQADVRDELAMRQVVDQIYATFGRLDGVIHGAGVIEDKLIVDKTPESFDRVFDTKADSAFVLSRVLRPADVKFVAFFSSAAGRFGNRGQADYAATNEVVNKLAALLNALWPGRVFSINWGPWATRGMVSPALQREFARRGIELIPLGVGRRVFMQELQFGHKAEAEVTIAGGTWGAGVEESQENQKPRAKSDLLLELPLLKRASFSDAGGETVEVVRNMDPAHDLYLADHRLDGTPVMPAAVAMEFMAEIAKRGWGDLEVVGLRDVRVLRGVRIENGPKPLRLVARAQADPLQGQVGVNVQVEISDPNGAGRPYYRGIVELADRIPPPPPFDPPVAGGLQPFPITVEEAYRDWLFHGPVLQGITQIHGFSDEWVVATCQPSLPQDCMKGAPAGSWLIDPVACDSGLQLILLWSRAHNDVTPLPSRLRHYQRFGPLAGSSVRCYVQAQATSEGRVIHANLYFVGEDGRLLGILKELECTGSKALNRLAGRHSRDE